MISSPFNTSASNFGNAAMQTAETAKAVYTQEEARERAAYEKQAQVEKARITQEQQIAVAQAEKVRTEREAQIAAEKAQQAAEIEKQTVIQAAEIARQKALEAATIEKEKVVGASLINKETAIETARIGKIVAVASGKGGVGKSTTSANVALAFKKQGLKVGVLDADVYGPSMPRLFGIKGKPDMADNGKLAPKESFGVKVMSIGFLVQDEQPIVWRGPMVMSAIKQLLEDVEWGDLDVLVVDMPPGTGDAQLTLAQTVPLAGAIIVSTPQDLALIDARRGIAMFQQVHVPLVGVVENMSYFVCPHCGGRSDVFAHGGARHEAEKLGVPFLGEAPLHMSIRETSDAGVPVVVSAPDSPQANAYIEIARKAWENLTAGPTGARPAPRIVVN